MTHSPPRKESRLLLGAGIVGIAFSLRLIFASLSVRLPEVVRALHLSALETSLATTLPVLCLGLCAPFAPRLAERFGIERCLFGALALIAAGTALRAAGPAWALFAFSILAGAAIATANVLLPSLVKRDFDDRTSLVTGLYVMGISGGAALAAAVTVPIEQALGGGWQLGLSMWAVPVLLALLLWAPQALRRQTQHIAAPVGRAKGLWRDRLAWQVAMFMGLQSALAFSAMTWLAPILRERGLSAVAAGLLLSVLIVVQLITCLATPGLAVRARDQRPLAMLLVAGGTAGMIGLLFAPLWSLPLWALLQGLAQGGLFALALTLVLLRSRDAHVAAHLSSMAQSLGYVPAALAPLLIGLLRAWTGSFAAVGGLFALLGIGLVWSGLGAARSRYVGARAVD
ncbi:MAG: major facilitator superfamily 1 [Alphaproteobacteria bacterium]|nr:major facilitator superfamily 1 [Alphaproteobacteria bacterium]MDB5719420.1 major facilitator superfamily 1 [Alphaproteobacteria bacterium]